MDLDRSRPPGAPLAVVRDNGGQGGTCMKEVKTPKKPLAIYYAIVLVLLLLVVLVGG